MAVSSLRIGIETEVLLCAHNLQDQCKGTLEDFAEALIQYYNTMVRQNIGQIEMRSAFGTCHASDDPINFRYWSVMNDMSIDPDEGHWGLEFASPIIRYEAGSSWRQGLKSHFRLIKSYAKIMSDITCGTHVHVSPGDREWTLEEVKNVSRSILYFEEAFEVLLPAERRGNRECRSNRSDNPKLKHLPDLETCFGLIRECTTIKALIHLMNAKDEYSWQFHESTGESAGTERCYGFNFENLMEGKIGTIEFRRPPCVTNYLDCVMWVEFGASFMQAAMQFGTSADQLQIHGPDVAGLAAFVGQAAIPDMNDQGILDRMFARGSGCLPVGEMKYDHYY
ncbi:putative amidoligase enzyme-domain-containing protein [Usnea florida]